MNDEQAKELLKQYDEMRELMIRMNANMQQINTVYQGLEDNAGKLQEKLGDVEAKADQLSAKLVSASIETPSQSAETPTVVTTTPEHQMSLKEFFKAKGLEVVDKRDNGGSLWVIGDEQKMKEAVEQAEKLYDVTGKYGSGRAIQYRNGWWTKSKK